MVADVELFGVGRPRFMVFADVAVSVAVWSSNAVMTISISLLM
jgi:hypothetical protein